MARTESLEVGDPIDLHVAYNDSWSRGFEIAAVVAGGYQIRRVTDSFLLPAPTGPADVRPSQP
jgi:hypothetical protein